MGTVGGNNKGAYHGKGRRELSFLSNDLYDGRA
jgi:hypothetical protein